MVTGFLDRAKSGHPVYIHTVHDAFNRLPLPEKQILNCVLTLLMNNETKLFQISLPVFDNLTQEEINFVKSYVWAEIYNILSSLGGKSMTLYVDCRNKALRDLAAELNDVF